MRSQSYRCPNCSGKLVFEGELDVLRCAHCGNTYTPEEAESANRNSRRAAAYRRDSELHFAWVGKSAVPSDASLDSEDYFFENAPWRDRGEGHLRHAECETCGASLYVDENQVSCNCPYCGNNLVIKGLVSGEMTPDLIAPFRISRQKAADKLLAHCRQGLLPAGFSKRVTLEHIVGVYVPFWLYDADVEGSAKCVSSDRDISFSATFMIPSIAYEVSAYTYNLKYAFSDVPADASTRMPDGYMDSIEPFDLDDARPFKASYLVDHVAELRDVSSWECCKRVTFRMLNSVWNGLASTFVECDKRQWLSECADLRTNWKRVKCCYLPVWMLHARWRGRNVLLAVNGQTGKVASRLPAGKVKRAALHIGSAALRIAACAIASLALWMVGFFVVGFVLDGLAKPVNRPSETSQIIVFLWVVPFLCAIGTGWIINKGKQRHRRAIRKREDELRTAQRGNHADDYLQSGSKLNTVACEERPSMTFFNPIPGMKTRSKIDKSFGIHCGKDSFRKVRPKAVTDDLEDEWISIVKTR